MARLPSLTPQEAETKLGSRGTLIVNSDNRSTVKKWLTAKGFPASAVAMLSMRELALAYNQTDGSGLAAIKRKYDEAVIDGVIDDVPEASPAKPPLKLNTKITEQVSVSTVLLPDASWYETMVFDGVEDRHSERYDTIEQAQQGHANAVVKATKAYTQEQAPQAPTPVPTPAPALPASPDAIELLRQLLLGGYKPGIDENQVRAIVQEQIAGVAPRVIEVRHDDKPPVKIEGLVHPEFERALHYLSKKGPNGYQTNVMLVGPAGCGKSHMIGQLAKALDTDHTIVSGTAGATEGDLIGRLLPGDGGKFEYTPSQFIKLYERGKATLGFDEIDGFDANMLMIANMPLANGHMYVHLRKDNPQVNRGDNVYFIATANTYGTSGNPMYVGRNPMDEATRDRFVFITVDYDKRLEESIAAAGGLTAAEMAGIWELRDRAREAQLRRVISTRAFQKAAVMKQCGDSWREIRDRLLEGWSKDEKAKVGV